MYPDFCPRQGLKNCQTIMAKLNKLFCSRCMMILDRQCPSSCIYFKFWRLQIIDKTDSLQTSALSSSPPHNASNCDIVTSSDISRPDIFWTTSFKTSKSKLFPALSWLVTYCSKQMSSIGYFLNTVPQNTARPNQNKY